MADNYQNYDDDGEIESIEDGSETRPLLHSQQYVAGYTQVAATRMASKGVVSFRAQYIAAACATIGAMALGAILGFSSPAGAILATNSTSITLSSGQISWFSSSLNIGALVGGQVGGFLINYFGRRGTMILVIIPHVIGWALIGAAQNFIMLLLGRLVTGLCCGMMSVTIPTYIGEFSSPQIRGLLGSGFQLMVTIGVLYAYAVGAPLNNFRWIALICLIIPFIFSASMIPNKESPVYLLAKGKDEEASQALQHFRGKNYDISLEIRVLKDTLEENQRNKVTFKDLQQPYILKPFLMSLGLMFFQQVSGINAVLFNLETIFVQAGSSMDTSTATIIVGVTQVIGTGVAAVLADKAGRKILLLLSAGSMILSLMALGVYFYLVEQGNDVSDLGWLPLISLAIFVMGFAVGYGPVPWLMMSELFSSNVREKAGGFAASFNWTWAFIVTVTFQPLQNALKDSGVYWMFAAFNLLGVFFVVFFVYETKGKSIEEITAHFGGRKVDVVDESCKTCLSGETCILHRAHPE